MNHYRNLRDSLGLSSFFRRKPEESRYRDLDEALQSARTHLEAQGWRSGMYEPRLIEEEHHVIQMPKRSAK